MSSHCDHIGALTYNKAGGWKIGANRTGTTDPRLSPRPGSELQKQSLALGICFNLIGHMSLCFSFHL